MRLITTVLLTIGLLLTGTALAGRCPKPCRQFLTGQFKTCKRECAKGRAGKPCRLTCAAERKSSTETCKLAVHPAPPLCGAEPIITPPTTTTTMSSNGSTSSSSSTTSTTSTTLAACTLANDGFPCQLGTNLCTPGICSNGTCTPGVVKCSADHPCYDSPFTCNPSTGRCEATGYHGDGAVCVSPVSDVAVCYGGACAPDTGCVIDGVAYAPAAQKPGDPCQACEPGFSTTAWSPSSDGTGCELFVCMLGNCTSENGLCVGGACEPNFCLIDGAIRATAEANPANPCQTCQPAVNSNWWSSVADGTACASGICVGGTCNPNVCFIDGAVVQNGAGINPILGDACTDSCIVSQSRTSWSALPNFTPCGGPGCAGGACLSGFCEPGVTNNECASDDCRAGFCDTQTGACTYTPTNVGGACSVVVVVGPSGVEDCRQQNGTCDAAGNCVRAANPGVACANPSPPPCPPDAGATCDASGACVGKIIVGAVCQINCDDLFHDPQNQDVRTCQPNGICDFSIDSKGNSVGADIPCPSVPTGCAPGACDPQINACAYPVNPNGTLVCNSDVGCCPGQICLYPPGCDSNPGGCVGRFCYYPNSVP